MAAMDWSNVLCAGGAVLAALMPIPAKYDDVEARRDFFHNIAYTGSDVGAF
jgi:hypothetical protein